MQTISGIHYQNKKPISVLVEDGMIQNIITLLDNEAFELPLIAPGLVDLQVNGYNGIDFNSTDLTVADVMDITFHLLAQGVTTYYPTVITNSKHHIKTCLQIIAKACTESKIVNECIGGIHLEGPFISTQEGPVGAHNQQHVQAPDWLLFQEFYKASAEKIKIITLSPEWPQAAAFTKKCVQKGVLVSIGHTAASSPEIAAVINAGASMSTHLGNGTHQILPRHPNYIWDQLADERLSACIIGDSFHLPNSVIKVVMKVKRDKAILVSDSVSLAGMPSGSYQTQVGGEVVLTPEGKLHLKNKPNTLAGSAQTLLQGVTNLYQQNLCTLADAWDMASVNAARAISTTSQKGLEPGAPADLVLFYDNEKKITISTTYKNGVRLYDSQNLN